MDDVAARLLGLIRSGAADSRAALVEASGLARGTVTSRLEKLIDSGLVISNSHRRDTGGRPAERLVINPERGLLLGADIGGSHTRVGVMDLSGKIVASRDHVLDVNEGPRYVLDTVKRDFSEMVSERSGSIGDVMGIAIGLPGPVEHLTGVVVRPPTMQGWDGFVVPDYLGEDFDVPMVVDKDTNLMAIGEWQALDNSMRDALVLKVGMGIGAGIIANGAIVRGAQGAAGDLGHLPRRGGVACRCGQIGCAEATAGGWAIARELRESFGRTHVRTSHDILRLAEERDPATLELLRRAGRRLGEVLADAIGILNPRTIIVGGNLAASSDEMMAGIRERVYEDSHPLATKDLRIEASRLGESAGLAGAAILAADAAFNGKTVERLLAS